MHCWNGRQQSPIRCLSFHKKSPRYKLRGNKIAEWLLLRFLAFIFDFVYGTVDVFFLPILKNLFGDTGTDRFFQKSIVACLSFQTPTQSLVGAMRRYQPNTLRMLPGKHHSGIADVVAVFNDSRLLITISIIHEACTIFGTRFVAVKKGRQLPSLFLISIFPSSCEAVRRIWHCPCWSDLCRS